MKSFLDNKLEKLTNRHFNRAGKSTPAPVKESGPSIYQVIQAIKEESKERPNDKGMKYAIAQFHFFGRKNGYNSIANPILPTITKSCSKMFPYSRVASILSAEIEKSALKIDTKFLDKVAETINTQDGYDNTINKLEVADNSLKSVETRKYLSSKVNILKGADTVNNLMYEIEEVTETTPLSESILDHKMLSAYQTPSTENFMEDMTKESDFHNIIDFAQFPVQYETFDVRTAQYQILDTLPQDEWTTYLDKMASAGISVLYDDETDTFEVSSFKRNAEDPKDTQKLEYEPASKSPSNVKKTKVPGEEGKKEVEVINKLTGQAAEAFTKIMKRTEQLRKLKDKQLEIQANLTAIKNSYTEEKESVAVELEGYLKFAETSFQKLGLFEETAYALESSEGLILAAIKETSKTVVPEDPTKQIISADAQTIIDRLKKMGKITEELVAEVEKQINDENSLIKTITHITKTIYTWPPAAKDVEKVKGSVVQAGPMDKFMSFLKGAIGGVKKFFGIVDRDVDEFMSLYQDLQEFLEKE